MKYEVVIGLETHVELSTKTKIFCSCTTEFGGEVNTHCCPICLGLPGSLPSLNKKAIEYIVKAGLATNCNISENSKMDRKNYCYPDLPKAYQISQHDIPFCSDGHIELSSGKIINIERIHLEEDAGKLIHKQGELCIDYNRGGVPLIEIVTKPDFRNADEVRDYLEQIQTIMRYIEVSDCRMEEGSMRCDVNISVREKGSTVLGVRSEIKNMNSFTFIEKAIAYESGRHIDALENGQKLVQDTRKYIQDEGRTVGMREKEDANDYRYFRDPDLSPIKISRKFIDETKLTMPELPESKVKRYTETFCLSKTDAEIISKFRKIAEFFDEAAVGIANPKIIANFLIGQIFSRLETEKEKENDLPIPASYLNELVLLLESGKITNNIAKKTLDKMLDEKCRASDILSSEDLTSFDSSLLESICKTAVEENPKAVADIKAGKAKAIGSIMGKIMKETKGKADPSLAEGIVLEIISKE